MSEPRLYSKTVESCSLCPEFELFIFPNAWVSKYYCHMEERKIPNNASAIPDWCPLPKAIDEGSPE